MEDSRAAGWEPLEPLHEELLEYVAGWMSCDAPDWGDWAPVIEWPWDRWELLRHCRVVVHHLHELDRIRAAERR